MIKAILRPFYRFYKQQRELSTFKKYLRSSPGNLKIVVGTSGIYEQGWIPTEVHFLNLLQEKDWEKYFLDGSISNILAEHVWEHLSFDDGCIAARTCFRFLKKGGGTLRIAVPDGFHPSPAYIDMVKPGGSGAGADDHKLLYNYKSMTQMLEQAGFKVNYLEYFDENGEFHAQNWDIGAGFINRSIRYDRRNVDGKPNYTSLIVDAVKE